MARSSWTGALARFGPGAAGVLVGGLAAFRTDLFRPDERAFQCLTHGLLVAGVFALARVRRWRGAGVLIGGYVALGAIAGSAASIAGRLGLTSVAVPEPSWPRLLAAVLVGLGAVLVAWIYELLADSGLRFGKFLVIGPLLGGVFLAVGPLWQVGELVVGGAVRALMYQLFLGVLIGDAVALGVELAELVPGMEVPPAPAQAAETRAPGVTGRRERVF